MGQKFLVDCCKRSTDGWGEFGGARLVGVRLALGMERSLRTVWSEGIEKEMVAVGVAHGTEQMAWGVQGEMLSAREE